MQIDFEGACAVVTGGANGIGFACAERLVRSGADVWILDLDREQPSQVAAAIGARGLTADVTDGASLERALDEVAGTSGEPSVLVANAGIGREQPLLQTSDDNWSQTLAVNLTGVFLTVRAAARRMAKARRGAIVVTASTNSFDGEGNLTAYNTSKAGLLGLVHTAANEMGPYGVRINAVCPGLIRTRLTKEHFGSPERMKEYFRDLPLGRGGEPEEVAAAVVFLASGAASFITGTTLVVDGGQMATKFGPWDESIAEFSGDRWKLR
jgi:NAD(P)-dependent dehydrogenase (short-subunit alcohol dehydrogenase family)